jgi:hypothetical protein
MNDNVNSPKHYILYTDCNKFPSGLEVMDIREALAAKIGATTSMTHLDYSDWDRALEYLIRAPFKNGKEDIEKAEFYIDRLRNRMRENGIDNFKKL